MLQPPSRDQYIAAIRATEVYSGLHESYVTITDEDEPRVVAFGDVLEPAISYHMARYLYQEVRAMMGGSGPNHETYDAAAKTSAYRRKRA